MNQRFYALDVFRGMTVAFMIMVNNPAKWDEKNIFSPLDHAPWHGCTPTDLIFPFFLFAVGNAMSFVMPKFWAQKTDSLFWKKVIKRTLLIFGIGLIILAMAPYFRYTGTGEIVFKGWEWKTWDCTNKITGEGGLRILGVLQRIALAYFFASIFVYFFKQKGSFYFSIILLLWYWLICQYGGLTVDPYSVAGYVGNKLDLAVLGKLHMIKENGLPFDPEGLLSTIPSIASVVFGFLVGDYIQKKGKTFEMLSNLLIIGLLLTFAGLIWSEFMPINKKLWTSSYVLYTTGIAILVLSVLIYLIEFKKINTFQFEKISKNYWIPTSIIIGVLSTYFIYNKSAIFDLTTIIKVLLTTFAFIFIIDLFIKNKIMSFFDAFGKNPLFIFVLAGFLPRILGLIRIPVETKVGACQKYLNPMSWFGEKLCLPTFENIKNGSLLYSILLIITYWFIAHIMDKKKIYVKV